MNYRNLAFLISMLSFLFPLNAEAQAEMAKPLGYGDWFYEMGGGDSYFSYRQSNKTTLNFGVGADWRLFRGCSFEPTVNITEAFRDVQNSIHGVAENLVQSGRGLITTWGLSKIQESYPALFNFIMNGAEDAKSRFQLAMKTCRDYQNDLKAGRDPTAGWLAYGKSHSWSEAVSQSDSAIQQMDAADEEAAANGVAWIGGERKGDRANNPINVISDVAQEGYSHIADPGAAAPGFANLAPGSSFTAGASGLTAANVVSNTGSNPLGAGLDNPNMIFDTSEEATGWIVAVVGERSITTCKTCQKLETKVGQGLRPQVSLEKESIATAMRQALQKNNPSAADLTALSVPEMGMVMTDQMLRSLKSLERYQADIMAGKLVSEIAMMRTMAKAMTARDIIKAGMQEPNVLANEQASLELNNALARIDSEVNDMLFETEIRKKVFSRTALQLGELSRNQANQNEVRNLRTVPVRANEIKDGAIVDDAE